MSDNEKIQGFVTIGGKIPEGEYSIDMTHPIEVLNSAPLDFTGCTLRGIPNEADKGAIITILGNNVYLKGGTFYGDKLKHLKAGPYGNGSHGIKVSKGATNVTLDGFTVAECMGDGLYVGQGENVTIKNVASLRNRRQGLSVISGRNISVTNCRFEGTNGTEPGAGIDLEPDAGGGGIDGVVIKNNVFKSNWGPHITVSHKHATVKNVTIKNNIFDGKSVPVKLQWVPPSLWLKIMALFGDYSKYTKEVVL